MQPQLVNLDPYRHGMRILRPHLQQQPATCTCTICAFNEQHQLKPNGDGQSVPAGQIQLHAVNNSGHQRRVAAGRQPPAWANGALHLPNPLQHNQVFQCIICTLTEIGEPRLGQGYSMNGTDRAAHLQSSNHNRRLRDGRLERYMHAHNGNMQRMPGELW
jgi:hypothetical protein